MLVLAFLLAYIPLQLQRDPEGLRHRYKKVEELNNGSEGATEFFLVTALPPPPC